MSLGAYRLFGSATRVVSVAALLGTSLLVAPVSAQPQAQPSAMTQVAAVSPGTMKETVEARIVSLHAALQITPDQEATWTNVAQTMRDNDATMQSMVAERAAIDPASVTAVDDLKSYEKFAKAHVRGLRKLIVSFETLYVSMPQPQKSLADQVFKTMGHEGMRSRN